MLLQSTNPNLYPNSHFQNQTHVHFSSKIPNSLSFSSGLFQNYLKKPIFVSTRCKNPVFITCSSSSEAVDYEDRSTLKWNYIHRKISMMEDPNMGSGSVLNEVENEGKKLYKWELCRVVKELRKYKRHKYALEVYEWMNSRTDRYRLTTSDTAIQLDLIAKVQGIEEAEQYFLKLPDELKDKKIYGSLLNAYVRARMRENAESIMNKMRNRGYASHPLPFNVMMTLYMNLNNHEKIESLISEMKEKNIPLDLYSYNIWLSSCGTPEKMEQVFGQMQLDTNIKPKWTTFCTMASLYIKFKKLDKTEECLKKIESRVNRRDRLQYHYLISLYGSVGNKDEVYRIWDVYKTQFVNIPNLGYHSVISSLVRNDDIEGAEKIYEEWLSVKSVYDPRLGNLLLGSYVNKGLSEKAKTFFDQMIEAGAKPSSMTWEILAEDRIKNRRIPEALSYLQNAASENSRSWKPKPANISSILKICEQEGDVATKDALFGVLRQVGCLDDASYMSYIPLSNGGTFTGNVPVIVDRADSDDDNAEESALLGQLQESL